MTLREYILERVPDETLLLQFADNQACADCPIGEKCEQNANCYKMAYEYLNEDI